MRLHTMGNVLPSPGRPSSSDEFIVVPQAPKPLRRQLSEEQRRSAFEAIVQTLGRADMTLDRFEFNGALAHELVGMPELVGTPLGEALFLIWDSDGDGQLNCEEIWDGVQALRAANERNLIQLTFDAYRGTSRHGGTVTRAQFLDFVTKSWIAAFRALAELASMGERRAAVQSFAHSSANVDALRQRLDADFGRLDTNRTGELTLSEFSAWALGEHSVCAQIDDDTFYVCISFASPRFSELGELRTVALRGTPPPPP